MEEGSNGYEKDKVSIEHRLTLLETTLKEIITNHLPHIEKKITWAIGILITTLIGVVTTLIGALSGRF